MMRDRAGDVAITTATGRIQPDRRWFGNTRVISQDDLDRYEELVGCSVCVCASGWDTHRLFGPPPRPKPTPSPHFNQLFSFREEMTTKAADPFSVVLRRKKVPMGLLADAAKAQRMNLLETEAFADTFGGKVRAYGNDRALHASYFMLHAF